jgi:hypothetical protein
MRTLSEKAYLSMFYVIDAYYSVHSTDSVGSLLSDLSPFIFKDSISADPAAYDDFCDCFAKTAKGREVDDVDAGYQAAKLFLQFYNDEFGFELEDLIRDFSYDDFKRAYYSLK